MGVWTGELGDLNHHTTSCLKRPWKCQYCDHESIYETGSTDHTPNCANYPLPCPNQCEICTVPRCQADSHLLECSLQLVECEFAGTGCDVKVPRRDLAGHMTENAQHHLMTATLLNLRLTRELHQKIEEKDKQIVELKQQMTDKIAAQLDQQKEYFDTKLQNQTETFDAKFQQQAMKLNIIEANRSFLRYSIGLFTCHKLTLSEFKTFQPEEDDTCSWYSEPFYNYPGGYRFKLNIDIDETGLLAYLFFKG